MAFFNAMPGAIAQGLIWGLMAIGVYISYKILDMADLTVEGSIVTGGFICVVLMNSGMPIWLSVLIAFAVGAVTGVVTGILHTLLGIPAILAGILTQLCLYSINLAILGGRSFMMITDQSKLVISMSNQAKTILVVGVISALVIVVLWLFFYTELGLTIKSTGDNQDMSRAQGINVNLAKVIGLAISNGIVALSGALLAQYNGSTNLNDGRGAIVIGLAAIFIGLSISLRIKPNFVVSLIGVIGGSIIYYMIFNVVMLLGLNTNYLKMLSAIIVICFLAVPYIKSKYFTRVKPTAPVVEGAEITQAGGEANE
ncbi:MAG: ABC transporter permease [Clostridia bacterium]|nr:ABC transporter permease [Clostridia bacterium]